MFLSAFLLLLVILIAFRTGVAWERYRQEVLGGYRKLPDDSQ